MRITRIPDSMLGLAEQLGRIPTPEEAFQSFLRPLRVALARKEMAWMDEAEIFELESDGDLVKGYSWGEGEPVILAHGWNGRAANLAAFGQALVERGYRVLAIDAPGHGESGGEVCHAPRFAGCLLQLEERYGQAKGLVAHSFGTIAATIGQMWGLGVEKVVYLSPLCTIRQRFYEYSAAVGLDQAGSDEMWQYAEAFFGPGKIDQMNADIVAPGFHSQGLLIHDEDDREVAIEESEAIVMRWSNAELWRTSGLGHFRILRSRHVIDRTVAFISK